MGGSSLCIVHVILQPMILLPKIILYYIMGKQMKRNPKALGRRQKLKSIRKRRVHHQLYQPLNPMSLNQEDAAIDMCYVLFCILTLHLGPAIWNFLSKKGKKLLNDPKSTVLDSYEFIKTLIDRRTADSTFFTTNNPSDLAHLKMAKKGRCAVAHGHFDEIAQNWSSYLLSWIQLLKMIDAHGTAATVEEIRNQLMSGVNEWPQKIIRAHWLARTTPNSDGKG